MTMKIRRIKKYGAKKERSLGYKITWTVFLLFLYRVLSHIPLPFVDSSYVKNMLNVNGSLGVFNTLTGGNLANMSVVALGITPYITASIVLQLMGVLIPSLAEMQKDGSTGKKRMNQITIVLSVILGLLQSVFMMMGYGKNGLLSTYAWYTVAICAGLMTVGVFVLAWFGQLIQERFFGNGVSLILTAGILCSFLEDSETFVKALKVTDDVPMTVLYTSFGVLGVVFLFGFSAWLNYCEKRIQVVYSSKVAVNQTEEAVKTSIIPLKLIGGSVVPVIFASTILGLPALIQSFTGTDVKWLWMFNTSHWLSADAPWASIGILFYFALIIWFGYYYQMLNMNEAEIALNLRKHGGVIAGVRPGTDTEKYLHDEMRYLTMLGGIGMCFIAFVPIAANVFFQISSLSFLGTSIIIVVSSLGEIYGQFKAAKRGNQYIKSRKGKKHVRKSKAYREARA